MSACEWDYEETLPELERARDRGGLPFRNRSVLAAHSMQVLGYRNVASLEAGAARLKDY